MSRRKMKGSSEEDGPMSMVSNLFDVAMVFAVAWMVALVSRFNMTEIFSQEDYTIVKNPRKEDMEIITKKGRPLPVTSHRIIPASRPETKGKG